MIITLAVGSKCALMLPREFINPQSTPATGMIINKLLGSKHLILVEEVWQFKGLNAEEVTTEMCHPNGDIKHNNWGWKEVPYLTQGEEYLIVPALPHNLMKLSSPTLDAMIKKSITDFKKIHGFV